MVLRQRRVMLPIANSLIPARKGNTQIRTDRAILRAIGTKQIETKTMMGLKEATAAPRRLILDEG
jgi:hypothetical protein